MTLFPHWLRCRFAPSLVLLCLPAVALERLPMQDSTHTGSLVGKVRDSEGHPLPGASVTVQRFGLAATGGPHILAVTTDIHGIYLVPSLAYGAYVVRVALRDSEPMKAVNVEIKAPKTEADISFTNQSVPPLRNAASPETPNLDSGAETAAPTFIASGVEGTMAPSGYAAGASAEESAQIISEARKVLPPQVDLSSLSKYPLGCVHESELTRNAAEHPGNEKANRFLGLFYLQHGEPGKGLPLLEQASRLQPADADIWLDLGAADIALRRFPFAVTILQKAVAITPAMAAAHRLLAAALAETGDISLATNEYLRAIDLDPGEDNLFRSAVGLLAAGRPEIAIGILRNSTHRHPDNARLWLCLGIAQAVARQRQEAVTSLLKASTLAPASAAPNPFLADLTGTSSFADEQIQVVLHDFVLIHPGEGQAHLDYALFLSKKRTVRDASATSEVERQLRSAIERDPQLAAAHFQLGVLYAEAGRDQEAIEALATVVRLQPEYAPAHYRLALAYRSRKMMEASAREMEAFRRLHAGSVNYAAISPQDAATALLDESFANRRCPAPE